VLPEEMELMQEVEQAVEYGQLPQPVDLKWWLSDLVRRIFAIIRIGHFHNETIQQIQSFFKSNSFWNITKTQDTTFALLYVS
jgi:hypothetical protein